MINNIHTLGLVVNTISPLNNSKDININDVIKIEFNSHLNTITLVNSIFIYEDKDNTFKSLEDKGTATLITVNISDNKNGSVSLKPHQPLQANCRYIVFISKKVESTMGDRLSEDFTSEFTTEAIGTFPPVIILNDFGQVCETPPVLKWVSQDSAGYKVQVGKEKTFENLVIDKVVNITNNSCNEMSLDLREYQLDDGSYYYRIKSFNGTWSDCYQFFIKKRTSEIELLSQEDIPEGILFGEEIELELNLLESFPSEDMLNVSTKINVIYNAYEGQVDESRFNLTESFVEGVLFDSDDEDEIIEQGLVEGKWTVIYDSIKDITYIVFVIGGEN